LQDTLKRLGGPSNDVEVLPPILICGRRHKAVVAEQMRDIGLDPSAIVLEPMGRNSGPAAAIAARLAEDIDSEALVILMSADHHIADSAGFRNAVLEAAPAARDHIVTFGVTPTGPETGYGYIEAGDAIASAARKVVRFTEKPDLATATSYVAGGRHLWNAGMFLFSPEVLLSEMQALAPQVLEAADLALARAERAGPVIELDSDAFGQAPSISIDYAIMEKTGRAAVAPIGVPWADVGSWSELWRLGGRDHDGNLLKGDAVAIDAENTLVWAGSRTVAVIGVKDLVVVETDHAVLVLPRERAQDVKLLVEQIAARAGR
jgi:mannose-1-phosphate guanylyltransferase/mannose-6-phosphate isomerase